MLRQLAGTRRHVLKPMPCSYYSYRNYTTARRQVRHIGTLHPQLIQSNDFVDLSNTSYPKLRTGLSTDRIWGCSQAGGFPSGSRGFLYYRPSEFPLDPGEIRLRVTNDANPSSFTNGRDLLQPEGYPWCTKVPTLASQSIYVGIRGLLVRDGLVSEAAIRRCASIGRVNMRPSQLYTLEQPFHIDLSRTSTRISVINGDEKSFVDLHSLTVDQRSVFGEIAPYNGHIMARFEISTLPQHQSSPTLVLRILEFLTPVKCVIPAYDYHIQEPTVGAFYAFAGSLYTIRLARKSKKNKALRTLLPTSLAADIPPRL
ncbi:hypothetical protein D9615_000824 [Tricholomella constricta]|uniref:Uncharacterized protein n=1 Tax=Tricholomella constricta TaxID=117010 RepID=A0A8H5HS75_9AGAR|nr:hypothetical protein D9615_000824 [Tricholomella constricta]